MAGTKINTKARKDDRSKGNKSLNTEDTEDHDFSLLRKPVLTSITGFAQARKIFDFATEELKSLLANECDLLYECKVCRNIFRSLANFISHKRVYCKEKFNSSVHSHFAKNNSTVNEILKIKQMEEAYQDSLKVTDLESNENEDRIPLTKDLTGIMEKLTKIKGRYSFDEQQVTLQKIPNSSVAVFQSHFEENKFDNMLAQVQELDNMISRDNAVLQSDGSFNVQSSLNADNDKTEDPDNVIQISDDEDSDDGGVPKCKICDMQFSTQKTLKFHMKYKHMESRLVFPCPDCLEIFSTSWSVYRHLFKVHRKSAAQIRRLRDAIQAKAFRMNNPPAFYEKKKNSKQITPQKISEEERLDQENQAWMDNMEGDGELPRCGGCGRTFERRAALAAHTHTCQPRSRALARRPDAKRIEIQIRKDYNKGPTGNPLKDTENKQPNEENQNPAKPPEKNMEPAEITPVPSEKIVETEEKATDPMSTSIVKVSQPEIILPQKKPELREHVLEEATMDIIDDRSSDSVESPEKVNRAEKKTKARLPFAYQAEKSNLAAFKQRLRDDVDVDKLVCKKCDAKHTRMQELHEHMAGHYKWMRYACKLCNFKNYDFEKLPEHVKVVHKLKGDSDFYFSTVKALDGTEASELAEPVEESDVNEESSESRRPSRCSSDSGRLSDDSSSSSAREVGARKRKMYHNRSGGKKKKDNDDPDIKDEPTDGTNNIDGSVSPSNVKAFEENSSDIDDLEEKLAKQANKEKTSYVSRRPVRKKTKPKNEDFEYDLSNLLKMEAQGYRDSQVVAPVKPIPTKKKLQQELQSTYDNINREHVGALALLSKKAVDRAPLS
ncbi:zinc finger protein 800 [Leguminivora glycinivorella]|uniref:zinc finger protein 800 n=1 Tax=Leguminivora glycinivorella TaxID=1035111 RepID=UPI00200E5D77|nr:zinc finger protein 800 [Leguminivora glycinivorella]XP_048007303.1 zinc finger protein 800 [Leguminivora glycinivorella]